MSRRAGARVGVAVRRWRPRVAEEHVRTVTESWARQLAWDGLDQLREYVDGSRQRKHVYEYDERGSRAERQARISIGRDAPTMVREYLFHGPDRA